MSDKLRGVVDFKRKWTIHKVFKMKKHFKRCKGK